MGFHKNTEGQKAPSPQSPPPAPHIPRPGGHVWTGDHQPTCEGLLDPAGLRHLHGHRGGDAPGAARQTAGQGGTWGEEGDRA